MVHFMVYTSNVFLMQLRAMLTSEILANHNQNKNCGKQMQLKVFMFLHYTDYRSQQHAHVRNN